MNTSLRFALELCDVFMEEMGQSGKKKPERTECLEVLHGLLLLYCMNCAEPEKKAPLYIFCSLVLCV